MLFSVLWFFQLLTELISVTQHYQKKVRMIFAICFLKSVNEKNQQTTALSWPSSLSLCFWFVMCINKLDYVYSLHPDKSPGNPIKHPISLPNKTEIFYSTPDCLAGTRQPKCLPDGAGIFNWGLMKHYASSFIYYSICSGFFL